MNSQFHNISFLYSPKKDNVDEDLGGLNKISQLNSPNISILDMYVAVYHIMCCSVYHYNTASFNRASILKY